MSGFKGKEKAKRAGRKRKVLRRAKTELECSTAAIGMKATATMRPGKHAKNWGARKKELTTLKAR